MEYIFPKLKCNKNGNELLFTRKQKKINKYRYV